MDALIETRVPATCWVKLVTAVKEKAKTGHDWDGDFLRPGRLIDLELGAIVVSCLAQGNRRRPKEVELLLLAADGEWVEIPGGHIADHEWAYQLRKLAREYLVLTGEERLAKAGSGITSTGDAQLVDAINRVNRFTAEGGIKPSEN